MKPYYDDGRVRLFHGDCREVLTGAVTWAEPSVVIADPPYGETSLPWDRWPAGWLDAVGFACPSTVSLWCFGSIRMFLDTAQEFASWRLAQDVVWEKHNGSSSAADRFRRVHEHVLQFYRGDWSEVWKSPVTTPDAVAKQVRRKQRPPQWGEIGGHAYTSVDGGPRLARSVIKVRSCHGYAVHPTQKPLGILEPLIRYSTPPGGVVLDPFAGSGSTLITAKQLGFSAIGIEIDERYCEAAARRLDQGILAFGAPS